MNLRSTLVLALIFAALAGYLYYVELPRTADENGGDVLLDIDPDAVSRIELEHPGRKVVLERRDGAWQMIEPVAAPADQRNVDNLIAAVDEAVVERTLAEAGDLASFGLDVPSATIRLQSGEQSPRILHIGKNAPVGASVYVRRDGEKEVRLSDAALATRLDQQPADLRDKTILSFDKDAVTTVSISGADGGVSLARQEGDWRITAPGEWKADQAAVEGLLSTLQSMRAVEFLSEDGAEPARYGLDAPTRVLTLTFAPPQGQPDGAPLAEDPLELRIGNDREGKLHVQTNRRPIVYAVASWAVDSAIKSAGHFRDKTIVSFAAEDAARIEIASPAESALALVRTDGDWTLAGDPATVVAQTAVGELLGAAAELHGFEVAADGPFEPGELAALGLDPARRSIRVLGRDGEQLAVLQIGPHAADGARTEYAAIADGSSTVFLIPEDIYQRLDAGAEKLIERAEISEGAAPPVPDGEPGNGIDENALDDAAPAGE